MNNDWAESDATYVCKLPKELGNVTALKERCGKLIAETESGIQFIVPTHKKEGSE